MAAATARRDAQNEGQHGEQQLQQLAEGGAIGQVVTELHVPVALLVFCDVCGITLLEGWGWSPETR